MASWCGRTIHQHSYGMAACAVRLHDPCKAARARLTAEPRRVCPLTPLAQQRLCAGCAVHGQHCQLAVAAARTAVTMRLLCTACISGADCATQSIVRLRQTGARAASAAVHACLEALLSCLQAPHHREHLFAVPASASLGSRRVAARGQMAAEAATGWRRCRRRRTTPARLPCCRAPVHDTYYVPSSMFNHG